METKEGKARIIHCQPLEHWLKSGHLMHNRVRHSSIGMDAYVCTSLTLVLNYLPPNSTCVGSAWSVEKCLSNWHLHMSVVGSAVMNLSIWCTDSATSDASSIPGEQGTGAVVQGRCHLHPSFGRHHILTHARNKPSIHHMKVRYSIREMTAPVAFSISFAFRCH